MIHGIDERDLLARLHDRHKRFSLDVYDYANSDEDEKLIEAQKNLKATEKELNALKEKLHPKLKEEKLISKE